MLEARTMLSAIQLYWDASPDTGLQAGNGNWSTTDICWAYSDGTRTAWIDGSDAHFTAPNIGTSSVTIASSVSVGAIFFDQGGYTVSSGSIELANGSGSVTTSADVAIASDISGDLTKDGTGTLSLTGVSSYIDNLTVSQGTLRADTGVFGWVVNHGVLQTGGGEWGTIDNYGYLQIDGGYVHCTLTNYGALQLNDGTVNMALYNDEQGTAEIADGFVGWLGNSGQMQISGGMVSEPSWNGGTLQITGGAIGDLYNDASLTFDPLADMTYGGQLHGNGTLTKQGSGTLALTGYNNDCTGGMTLEEGTLSVGSEDNLGGDGSAITFAGGTLQVTGNTLHNLDRHDVNWDTFDGGLDIAAPNNTFTISQSMGNGGTFNAFTGNTMDLSAGTRGGAEPSLDYLNSHNVNWADYVAGLNAVGPRNRTTTNSTSGGSGTLTKTGQGKLVLTGTLDNAGNTLNLGTIFAQWAYAGGIIKSGVLTGTLEVNSAYPDINFEGVTLNANAALSVTGGGGLYLDGNWSNSGSLSTTGGTLDLSGTWNNAGTISGGSNDLHLHGTWTNSGTITGLQSSVTFHVSAGGSVLRTGFVVHQGETYRLQASGTLCMENGGGVQADAEYELLSSGPVDGGGSVADWNLMVGLGGNPVKVHWGAYADSHVYTIELTAPEDGFLSAQYYDDVYWDNSGGLDLTVTTETPALGSLTVSDSTNAANKKVSGTGELYLGEDDSGNASIDLSAAFAPSDAGHQVHWQIKGSDDSSVYSGTFANGPLLTGKLLTPTETVHDYTVLAWLDANGNERLDPTEDTRTIEVHVLKADVVADSNRDGSVTDADDNKTKKIAWGTGAGTWGALVLPNCDKDNQLAAVAPDNWTGGDWAGNQVAANEVIDGTEDQKDLAQLVIRQLTAGALPADLKVVLELSKPEQDAYFAGMNAGDIVRIFQPTKHEGDNWNINGDEHAVLGPGHLQVTYVKNPAGPDQRPFDIFSGKGVLNFAVEGITPGATVDIKLTVYLNNQVISHDMVRIRVAPFCLSDNRQGVESADGSGKTVYVVKDNNQALRQALEQPVAQGGFGDHVDENQLLSMWMQDKFEIGFASAPYGSLAIVLPIRVPGDQPDTEHWVKRELLTASEGVCWQFPLGSEMSPDRGGNIEALPTPSGGTRLLCSTATCTAYLDFFRAQGVNSPLRLDLSWLAVGHVDEVVSAMPDGQHVAVPDPELAWALLLQSGVVPGNDLRDFNFNVVMPLQNSPLTAVREAIKTACGITSDPESTPARIAGTGTLQKGGAFTALLEKKRFFRIEILPNGNSYQVQYSDTAENGPWTTDPTPGIVANDCVFAGAQAYILRHWWGNNVQAGDIYTFFADPACRLLEMPVLYKKEAGVGGKAEYFTANNVNSLIGSAAVFTADTNNVTLRDYIKQVYVKAGVSTDRIFFCDDSLYANGGGSIHCGTNVRRKLPADKWWDRQTEVI